MMAISQENAYDEVFLNEKKVIANLLQTGEPRVESDVWYHDKGASNHMTGHCSKFHELDKSVSGRVKFRDGLPIAIIEKGLVLFNFKNGDQRLLNEVYTHSGKLEAFDAFKWYKKMSVESSGYKIKTLRPDCEGEFTSKEFAKFCKENGIARHLTAPYSPQQNEVVERRNVTVMEMARSLLKGRNVPGKTHKVAFKPEELMMGKTDQPSTFEEEEAQKVFQVKTFTFIGIRLFHLVGDEVVGGGEDSGVMKGLSECKASESNVRRIRVKDIIKEVEDHLKTYSSAEMDISWYVEGIR
ncbi:zinc finger, CCHC-type containing protein [Tanacetum coccineum]